MADLRNYAIVTASYWGFTITDGALRMLVLLHFHALGYKPLDLAFLFLLYEAMGIITNFTGGWIAARFGLRTTLFQGLAIQIFALSMLALIPGSLTPAMSVVYVMAAQAFSGIAKDLTKMSSKSAVKLVVPEDGQGLLFKWVSILTGSKNALKGVGFFVGGFLLQVAGFVGALFIMAGALAIILVAAFLMLKQGMGKAKAKIRGKDLFSKSMEINWLSAARIFLFASRDVWFVVGVPVFLHGVIGWNFNQVGTFMAVWVIGYGIMQAMVPRLLKKTKDADRAARGAILWGGILALSAVFIAVGLGSGAEIWLTDLFPTYQPAWLLVGGLIIFGLLFAVNSALHSYLIVAYSDGDKVALNVGFYYTGNAVGRFIGTLLSGLVYQYAGLIACLWVSAAMVVLAVVLTLPLGKKKDMAHAG